VSREIVLRLTCVGDISQALTELVGMTATS